MSAESRTKNITRNSITGILNKMITMLFPFVVRTLLIKYIGAEYMGLGSLFTSILQVFSLAELGLSSAIVFCMYKPIAEGNVDLVNAYYNFIRRIYKIIGFVILVAGLSTAPFLPHLISGDVPGDINIYILYFIYLFNTVISYFLFSYKEALLVANQRYDIVNNISSCCHIAMYVIQCALIVMCKNYYIYIIWLPISTLVMNVMKSWEVSKNYPQYKCVGKLQRDVLKELYKRISGVFLYKVCSMCRNAFDSIFLSAFLGLFILTKYQNYYYIMFSVGAVLDIIISSSLASIGNSIVTDTVDNNYRKFTEYSFMYNFLSSIAAICMFCLYQPFMKLWLGNEYMFSMDIVVLLCLYFYLGRAGGTCYAYRQAIGLWWEDRYRAIVESVANLFLNYMTVKIFGVAGVLISTIVTIAFINIPWGEHLLFKLYFKRSMKPYILRQISDLVILSVICLSTYKICSLISIGGFLGLTANACVCVICGLALLFLVNILFHKTEVMQAKEIALRMLGIWKR